MHIDYSIDPSQIGIDNNEFRSSTFQRVYQYLRRHASGQKLDQFRYQKNVEGTTTDCLHHFLKYINFICSMFKVLYSNSD